MVQIGHRRNGTVPDRVPSRRDVVHLSDKPLLKVRVHGELVEDEAEKGVGSLVTSREERDSLRRKKGNRKNKCKIN